MTLKHTQTLYFDTLMGKLNFTKLKKVRFGEIVGVVKNVPVGRNEPINTGVFFGLGLNLSTFNLVFFHFIS